jgi:peroxiredoxin
MRPLAPFVLIAGLLTSATLAPAADVIRKGAGAYRANLNKLELHPFPADAWSKLGKWTGGDPISASSTNGKPILICTWASWYPTSMQVLPLAQQMAEKYAKEGLVVIGVHSADGWEDAAKEAEARGVKFTLAHDEKGEFRKAILSDHDPAVYVVDRAGQLRFADIENASIPEAVATVVGETADAAADVPKKLAGERDRARADASRTGQIRAGDLGEVPFAAPAADTFKSIRWPKLEDPNRQNQPGQPEPEAIVLKLPDAGYMPAKPATAGRGIVLYFFHPALPESFSKIMPMMDKLQRERGRDLVVIGVLSPFQQMQNGQPQTADDTDPVKVAKKLESFRDARRPDHALTLDLSAGLMNQSAGPQGGNQAKPPYAVVLSSDGAVRWRGDPTTSSFHGAVDFVLSHDPGVKARQQAEREYIKNTK